MDYSRIWNQVEKIVYLKYKIKQNTPPQKKETVPDYSSTFAIMLKVFRIERYFCIISDCKNSFILHLKNLLKKNLNRKLVCVCPVHLAQYANTEFIS